MDHPLIEESNRELRKRVIQLFKMAYNVPRGGNIIFVCGGNESYHMRQQFKRYCATNLSEFDVFFPEFAMKDYFSSTIPEPFDIADFEQIVGELSHAIVIFPEAPGSFAETGYFSAIPDLSQKTILALNAQWQENDSFISMGPAKKIGAISVYQPNIQIDYQNPAFDVIAGRIRRIPVQTKKRLLAAERFSAVSQYELFAIIQKLVSLLSIATIDDIVYILNGIFSAHISIPRTRHITSILVGSKYLKPIGEYGHYYLSSRKAEILRIREGYKSQEADIRLRLTGIYETGDPEFRDLVEEAARDH